MKRPATNHARRRARAAKKPDGGIKVTRNSARPQIKASRGPGGPVKRRPVAQPTARRTEDRRVAETRRQSLSAIGAAPRPAAKSTARSTTRRTSGGGGGSVRAVALGAGGGAAAGAARVVAEVARPVGAVTRPVLRVVTGGLEAIPGAASRTTPVARGRLLILLAGVLAAGLIYINVGKLESGDGYTKYSARTLQLQRENTALRSRIASLNAAERIQAYAERQGMVFPAPEQFNYLRSKRGDAVRASRGMTEPLTHATPGSAAPSAATGAVNAAPEAGPSATAGAGL
ncbi:MAG: hypothetical protein JHD02_09135 [Thermoleophilaceae bacterium]|nr:hypothetical protein [Thermoleophilaceae bacterium]